MRQGIRLRPASIGLAVLGVIMALYLWPSMGRAQSFNGIPSWDPQTTNVPYLAWAGEEIRLEKCIYPYGDVARDRVDMGRIRANFLVEDWSGTSTNPNLNPQIEPSTVKLFWSDGGAFCAMGDAVSLYPGMARIELDIVDNAGQLGYDPASPFLKHQFLAGWMTLNQPTLTEMNSSSFASTAATEAAKELGDPSGNGQFTAGGKTGYLDVHVTGSMPMTGAWQSLVGASSVTLPNDWVTLAHALATDNNPSDTAPWNTWDTSGDSTAIGYEGHVSPQSPTDCLADPAQFAAAPMQPRGPNSYAPVLDNGDNCTGGGADGPFSTVFGTLSGAGTSIGPFDPLDPADTLLSDGNLSSQDAPMPAAQINVSIAPNSGRSGDTSGVGDLVAADKTKTYSRDFLGNTDDPQVAHNLYAPFYDAFIPATARGPVSSGVDGGYGNNFPGFLGDGQYHFWDTFSLANNAGAPTTCLQYSPNHDPQHGGTFYNTPSGDSTVAVYTDQNGEAQVQYDPGMGFYFDSLVANGSAIENADGGCDLQSLYNVPGGLGSSTITATAEYPFKPTDFPAVTSAPVTKSVMSEWSKTLSYDPKGPGAANNNSRIVIAHAQDINGDPFSGEDVCWVANGEGMVQWSGKVGGQTIGGSPVPDPKGSSFGRVCGTTDSNGNAAVEVLNSDPTSVDVIADFVDEGILRDITVDYATPGSSGGTPPPPPSGGTTGGTTGGSTGGTTGGSTSATTRASNSGTTAPSPSLVAKLAPALTSAAQTGAAKGSQKSRITLARFVSPAHGAHYALLRVSSGSRSARVRLRLLEKTKHGTKVVTRVVSMTTNRTIKLGMGKNVLRVLGVTIL